MKATVQALRPGLWWIVPMLALAILLGVEIDWGRRMHRLPEAPRLIEPRPVTPALLPEYKIDGGLAAHAETVNRTLFNPTRRPAPTAAVDSGRKQLQRGQFVLTGTTVAGDRSIAFLKEVAGGKSRTVRQGEQINGMLVAEVKPDRVKLTLADESEELVLKAAPGPRATVAPPPVATASPVPGAPGISTTTPSAQPAGSADAAQTLEQRRRAARAQASDAAVPAPVPAAQPSVFPGNPATTAPAPGMPASADPSWNDVYERMRQRALPPPK